MRIDNVFNHFRTDIVISCKINSLFSMNNCKFLFPCFNKVFFTAPHNAHYTSSPGQVTKAVICDNPNIHTVNANRFGRQVIYIKGLRGARKLRGIKSSPMPEASASNAHLPSIAIGLPTAMLFTYVIHLR
jgi:hypothetical protein